MQMGWTFQDVASKWQQFDTKSLSARPSAVVIWIIPPGLFFTGAADFKIICLRGIWI